MKIYLNIQKKYLWTYKYNTEKSTPPICMGQNNLKLTTVA